MNLIILISAIILTAYITVLVCNHEYSSRWQTIKYAGSSIEPEYINICKRCYYKSDIKYGYCPNCGANMINGKGRHYYSAEIDLLSEQEEEE